MFILGIICSGLGLEQFDLGVDSSPETERVYSCNPGARMGQALA